MRQDGFYWIIFDRASTRGIGHWLRGAWYLINERGPVDDFTLHTRGWSVGDYVGSAIVSPGDFYNGPSILTDPSVSD